MNKLDDFYLRRTIELAKKGEGRVSPNPLVGALIVRSKKIIARGYHHFCGGPHAEIDALRKTGFKAPQADMYVTLEPCARYGRTPPCTKAIIQSGIRRVIIGMKDPNPLNNGRGVRELKRAGIKVETADNPAVFARLNEIYLKYITRKMPYVIVKAGQSLDGKIALKSGASQWITNEKSRDYVQRLRRRVDAVLIGINTLLRDNPLLSCRLGGRIKADKPVKIILDSHLKTPVNAAIFRRESPAPVIIASAANADAAKKKKLEQKGARIIVCPADKAGRTDLNFLFRELARREIAAVLAEGGAEVFGACFDYRLADKVCFFIAPLILGGRHSITSVGGRGVPSLEKAVMLNNIGIKRVNGDLLVEADVQYAEQKGKNSC